MEKKHKRVYRTVSNATELFMLLKLTKCPRLVGCFSNGVIKARFTKHSCSIRFREPGRGRGTSRCRSVVAMKRPKVVETLISLRWRPEDDVGWNASPLILLAYEASRLSE